MGYYIRERNKCIEREAIVTAPDSLGHWGGETTFPLDDCQEVIKAGHTRTLGKGNESHLLTTGEEREGIRIMWKWDDHNDTLYYVKYKNKCLYTL